MSEASLTDVVLYKHFGNWYGKNPYSPPENLGEFIQWANEQLEQIPDEERAEREEYERKREENGRAWDLALLAELKRKYETPGQSG